MMIGCQEEEAQNHHCEGMVCEGEVIICDYVMERVVSERDNFML